MVGHVYTMTPEDCWDLLRRREFGRLAYHDSRRVQIVPVNFAVDQHRIIFRTAEGSKFSSVMENADVAFETDELTDEAAMSVIARGLAYELTGEEALMSDQLRLRPWIKDAKNHVVAVDIAEISGRFFYLSKPWTHMMR